MYQEHSKEGNAKTEELTSAVKELQGLLAEADKKYAKLETGVNEAKIKHDEVLTKKEETIADLDRRCRANEYKVAAPPLDRGRLQNKRWRREEGRQLVIIKSSCMSKISCYT